MRRLILATLASLAAIGGTFATFRGDATAAPPPLTATERAACAEAPPELRAGCETASRSDAIREAKMAAALAYRDYTEGRGSLARVERIERWLRAITGEAPREVVPSSPPEVVAPGPGLQLRTATRTSALQERFWPFR